MSNEFMMPKKILTGGKALIDSKEYLKLLGKKALIVTDSVMVSLGNVKMLTNILEEEKIYYKIYSDINGEPTDLMVEKGEKYLKKKIVIFL